MLVIDKEWLDKKPDYLFTELIKRADTFSFYMQEGFAAVPFTGVTLLFDLNEIPHLNIYDDKDVVKIDYLSNYSRPVPEEKSSFEKTFEKIAEEQKINYSEVEKELSKDETEYSDFETTVAGKEKKRFDMLEFDEEG